MSNEPQRCGSTAETVTTPDLTMEVAFDVLADGKRRAILSYLLGERERADLEDLAAHVAADADGPDERAATTLHHLHLPKLAAAGLISYDDEHKVAIAHDAIRDLEPYLEWARRRN